MEEFLGNLTAALQLPPGSIRIDLLQQAPPSTSKLEVSEASARRLLRLLLAEAQQEGAQQQKGAQQGKPQQKPAAPPAQQPAPQQGKPAAAAATQPLALTVTVSLDPEAAADSGGEFSAAWMEAALQQVAASRPADAPVQLGPTNSVTRCGGECVPGHKGGAWAPAPPDARLPPTEKTTR